MKVEWTPCNFKGDKIQDELSQYADKPVIIIIKAIKVDDEDKVIRYYPVQIREISNGFMALINGNFGFEYSHIDVIAYTVVDLE